MGKGGQRTTATHEGKESCSWQTAAGGMINPADTSVHFTTEQKDRWREGGEESRRIGRELEKQTGMQERVRGA